MKEEITLAALKSSPPVAVTTANFLLGIPIEKWVAVATLVYVVLQAYVLVRDKIWRDR
jgi:hypothetical protein